MGTSLYRERSLLYLYVTTHHAVGDDETGGRGQGREEAEGVARVHDESLLWRHLAQVVHHQPELRQQNDGTGVVLRRGLGLRGVSDCGSDDDIGRDVGGGGDDVDGDGDDGGRCCYCYVLPLLCWWMVIVTVLSLFSFLV